MPSAHDAAAQFERGMRGPLVALSGIDGSGKTTQAERLHRWFLQRDDRAVQVKARLTALQGVFHLAQDLYGDPHEYHPRIPATLREFTIAADLLSWSRDTLEPLLATGAPVVWDRSPLCYATYARCYGADMTWPAEFLSRVAQPDLIFLLDIEPSTAVSRILSRQEQPHQADEDEALLRQARETYLHLATAAPNVVVVHADREPDALTDDLIARCSAFVESGARSE